jgi:hypothetical protein
MSGPERPTEADPPPAVEPTRHAPTDSMARHEGVHGHGDHRDRHIREISAELNARSDFIQELKAHAEKHRNRVPPPDRTASTRP